MLNVQDVQENTEGTQNRREPLKVCATCAAKTKNKGLMVVTQKVILKSNANFVCK